MTDPTRPNGRPVGDPTPWVDLPTAAATLGVSGEAIRQRIKRGTLRAQKRDGRWYVALDPTPTQGPTQGQPVGDPTEPIEATYRVDGAPASTLVPATLLWEQTTALAGQIERLTREAMAAAAERDTERQRSEAATAERDKALTLLGTQTVELEQTKAERDALAARLDALEARGGPESHGEDIFPIVSTPAPWWARLTHWRRR